MPAAGKRTTVQTMQRIENVKVMGFDKDEKPIIGEADIPEGAYITSGGQEVKDANNDGKVDN